MVGFVDWKLSCSVAVRCHVLLESVDVLVLMAMQHDFVYIRTNVHGIEQKKSQNLQWFEIVISEFLHPVL
jgi:hypothetical protein